MDLVLTVLSFLYSISFFILKSEGQYLDTIFLDCHFTVDPTIATFNYSLHRGLKSGVQTSLFSFNADFYRNVSCEDTMEIAMYAKMKDVYSEEPFLRQKKKVEYFFSDFPDSAIGTSVEAIRQCFKPHLTCPLSAGHISGSDCYYKTKMTSIFMSKFWNVSVSYTPLDRESPAVAYWFLLEFDDTNILKARRPSTAQRARKQKNNKNS